MKIKRNTFAIIALAGMLACSKMDNDAGNSNDIKFAVSYVTTDTKGTAFDSESSLASFTVSAFNNDTGASDDHTQIMNNVVVTDNSGTWVYEDRYLWNKPYGKQFFAWANKPADGIASVVATYQKQTLTYTAVPVNAADQQDIMLGYYAGNGGDSRIAAISFRHPLTCISFKTGSMENVSVVKAVRIKGVYKNGSVVQNADGTIGSWSGLSTIQTVKQEGLSVAVPSTGSASIGVPFILIPQTATSLDIELDATVDGEDMIIKGTISDVDWKTGTAMSYKVDFDGGKGLNFSTPVVSDWGTGDALAEEMGDLAGPRPNEIWYWTANEQPITKSPCADANDVNVFGANIVTSTYTPGDKGVMKFDGPITKIGMYAFGRLGPGTDISGTNLLNMTKIIFPEGVTELENYIVQLGGGSGKSGVLEEVVIPRFVTTINWNLGTFGFCWCTVTVGYEDGISYSAATHPAGPAGCHGFSLTLGNGTTGTVYNCCFLYGTLITLADGSKKKVEDITYEDELLVWNFDKGCYDTAKILWLTKKGLKSEFYYKCTFSDGTVLNIVGNRQTGHRLFNATDLSFDHCNEIEIGKDVFTEHGNVKLVSCEVIDSVEVEYVNLITDQHINCFANEVLTSARYNNRYPIDKDMKFVKDDRKIRPYREFKKAGISRQWYDGMRLGEQQDSIARVSAYIDRCELNGDLNPDWKQPGFFARIWNWIKGLFSK